MNAFRFEMLTHLNIKQKPSLLTNITPSITVTHNNEHLEQVWSDV